MQSIIIIENVGNLCRGERAADVLGGNKKQLFNVFLFFQLNNAVGSEGLFLRRFGKGSCSFGSNGFFSGSFWNV